MNATTEKFLVLSYLYRQNWKAYLGPDQLKIYRAYGGLMAVRIPPGSYTVKFQYTPVDVYLGLSLTVLAFFIPVVAYSGWPFLMLARRRLEVMTSNSRVRLAMLVAILCVGTVVFTNF